MANILVVDRSPAVRKNIHDMLMQADIAVNDIYEAGDSRECLQILSSGKIINLILSDMDSTDMNGPEFVNRIRARRRFVPILMTCAKGFQATDDVLSAGAIEIIEKPYTSEQFQEKVVHLACEFKCIYCGNCKQ